MNSLNTEMYYEISNQKLNFFREIILSRDFHKSSPKYREMSQCFNYYISEGSFNIPTADKIEEIVQLLLQHEESVIKNINLLIKHNMKAEFWFQVIKHPKLFENIYNYQKTTDIIKYIFKMYHHYLIKHPKWITDNIQDSILGSLISTQHDTFRINVLYMVFQTLFKNSMSKSATLKWIYHLVESSKKFKASILQDMDIDKVNKTHSFYYDCMCSVNLIYQNYFKILELKEPDVSPLDRINCAFMKSTKCPFNFCAQEETDTKFNLITQLFFILHIMICEIYLFKNGEEIHRRREIQNLQLRLNYINEEMQKLVLPSYATVKSETIMLTPTHTIYDCNSGYLELAQEKRLIHKRIHDLNHRLLFLTNIKNKTFTSMMYLDGTKKMSKFYLLNVDHFMKDTSTWILLNKSLFKTGDLDTFFDIITVFMTMDFKEYQNIGIYNEIETTMVIMEAITNPNLTNNMGIKLDCLKLLYDISIGNYNVEAEFQTYLVKNQVIINQRLLELYLDINEDNSGNPYKSKDYLMKFLNFLNNHNYILEKLSTEDTTPKKELFLQKFLKAYMSDIMTCYSNMKNNLSVYLEKKDTFTLEVKDGAFAIMRDDYTISFNLLIFLNKIIKNMSSLIISDNLINTMAEMIICLFTEIKNTDLYGEIFQIGTGLSPLIELYDVVIEILNIISKDSPLVYKLVDLSEGKIQDSILEHLSKIYNQGEYKISNSILTKLHMETNKFKSRSQIVIPEKYLDPIMNVLIETPILVPNSQKDIFMEKNIIVTHLISNSFNPFNRNKLTLEELESYNERCENKRKLQLFSEKLNAWKEDNNF